MRIASIIGSLLAICVAAAAQVAGAPAAPSRNKALYVHVYDDAAETLQQLKHLTDGGHWPRAAAEAQRLIAEATGTLHEIEPDIFVSFAEKIRRDLCSWPEPGLDAYRALYEQAAAKIYEEAAGARSAAALSTVADLYLPTRAGALALAALADIHAQRGNLREAHRTLQRLLKFRGSEAPDQETLRRKLAALEAALRTREPSTGSQAQLFSTGTPVWSFIYDDGDVPPDVAGGLRARGLRVPLVSHPVICGNSVFVQTRAWVAALDGRTGGAVWRYPPQPERPASRNLYDAILEPVVLRDRVFAVIGGRVVALSAADGAELWAVAAFADEANAPDGRNAGATVLINSLAVGGGEVFVCATLLKQETELVVAALDARTGAILWRRTLCSQVFRGELGRGVQSAPPAYADGTLFVSTNLGAVAAMQPDTGEVRWLATYRAFTPERRRVAFRTDDCWENNRPVVCGGLVLVAPQDADGLIAFDVESGSQLWEAPRLGMRYLIGADSSRVYLSGARAAAVNLDTGKVAWLSERLGEPAGRPALSGPDVLVPTEDAFITLDGATGKALSLEGVSRAPGNLAVVGDRLASASNDRVSVYGRASHQPRPRELPACAADNGQRRSRAQMAVAEARERLKKQAAQHSGIAGNDRELPRAWRTPFDTTRHSPVVLAPETDIRFGESAVVIFATRDAGNPEASLWNSVECRRAADGWLIWRTPVDSCLGDAVFVDGKLVLRSISQLISLDLQTGKHLWTTGGPDKTGLLLGFERMLDAHRIQTVATGGGKVFAATGGGSVFGVDTNTGKKFWRRKLAAFPVGGALYAIDGQVIVCGENPGTVYWLDAETGRELRSVQPDRADNRLTDGPVLQRRAARLCLVVGDREVRNLRLDTGATIWKADVPFSIGRIATTSNEKHIVVFPDRWSFGGNVACMDAASGRVLWAARPTTKDLDRMHLADEAVISIDDRLAVGTLTARRVSDGQIIWSQRLRGGSVLGSWSERPRGGSVFGRWTDADDSVIISWAVQADLEWSGRAACVRKADGSCLGTFERPGTTYSSVAATAGLLLLCSNRGIEAYGMGDERATAKRLAAMLGADGPALPATNEAGLFELARLLFVHGEREAAMALLDEALLTENIEPVAFERMHEFLMALREAEVESRPAAYDAPRFPKPPEIDGRLAEDWRRDWAAVLDRARHIERVHAPEPAGRFWIGPNDLSATLYLGWDAEHLYIAVDVNDSVQVPHDFDAPVWKGDCLVVGIDPERDGGYRLGSRDTVFWLALTGKQQRQRGEEQRLGGEHSIKVKEDESGIVYELAVPWAEIGILRPRPGLCFGLNVMVIDDDGAGALKGAGWTPGLTQNRKKDLMSAGIAPALFGAVTLKEN